MTSYRLMDGASGRPGTGSSTMTPPSAVTSYSGNFQAGCAFVVTDPGMWFEGFWWFCPTGGDTGAQKFCLYAVTGSQVNASAPTLIPAATVTSGTLTENAWNYIALSTPIPLSLGHLGLSYGGGGGLYVATTAWTSVNGFPDTNNAFGSGDPYADGIANGPLETFGYYGGTTRQAPAYASGGPTSGQVFGVAVNDPATGCPVGTDGSYDNFWIDIQVTDTAPGGYSDSYRLYPNRYDTNDATTNDAAVAYTVATEITLSQSVTAQKIWYYSPAGTAQLATRASVWEITGVSSGTEVIAITSPAWKAPDGSSMTAGDGWCYCDTGNTVLSAGNYKVSIFNSAATPDGWSAKDASSVYWDTGEGANGAGFGPITAPKLSSASTANIYNGSNPGSTPPYSSGSTEPGQSTFAQSGVNDYPSLYVDTLAQNYWLDLEVSTSISETVSASVVNGTTTIPTPVVSTVTNAAISPNPVNGVSTIPEPIVHAGIVKQVTVVSGTTTIPTPSVSGSASVAANTVNTAVQIPSAGMHTGETVSPSVVSGSSTIPTAVVSTSSNASVTASVVNGTATIPTPSISATGSAAVSANPVDGTTSIPTPSMVTDYDISATAVSGATTIPAPTVNTTGNALVAANPVNGSATIPTPSVFGNVSITPSAVSGAATIPAPSVSSSSETIVQPATVNGTASIATPGVVHGVAVDITPSMVAATTTIPQPKTNPIGSLRAFGEQSSHVNVTGGTAPSIK